MNATEIAVRKVRGAYERLSAAGLKWNDVELAADELYAMNQLLLRAEEQNRAFTRLARGVNNPAVKATADEGLAGGLVNFVLEEISRLHVALAAHPCKCSTVGWVSADTRICGFCGGTRG